MYGAHVCSSWYNPYNSLPCGSLKFEEQNRTVINNFCLPVQKDDDLNQGDRTRGVYSSNTSKLSLTIHSRIKSNDSSLLRLYYRFISKVKKRVQENVLDTGDDLQGKKSICDHLFKQCNKPVQCSKLPTASDDAGSFTCSLLIRQQNQSTNNRIIISQMNKQPKQLFTNNQTSSPQCGRSIEFYEGRTVDVDKLIIKLCLPVHQMPLVRSSGELLVVYRLGEESLTNKYRDDNHRLELIAQSESRKARTARLAERDKKSLPFDVDSCNVFYNASTTSQRSGQIVFKNQLQDQPKELPCFMHLISSNPFDRIWFYFVTYRPASLLNSNSLASFVNQFPPTDSCRIAELRLFDSSDEQLYSSNVNSVNSLANKGKSFCGTSQPKICNPNRQQCFLPSESYLSTGPRLSLMAVNKINPSLYLLPLQFTLNYEFINTQEYGEAVPGTICDRLFDSTTSSKYRHGTVRSTRNLFLYGRGGRQTLNCAYIFRGQPNQRLRIQLYRIKVKSTDCVQQREPNSGANKCVLVSDAKATNGPTSRFSVWDSVPSDHANGTANDNQIDSDIRIPVDCFCNKTVNFLTPISFHLVGGQATLNFTIENMRPNEDYNDYGFEAFYEFLSTSNDLSQQSPPFVQLHAAQPVQVRSNPPRNYTLTTYQLTVPSNYSFDYYQEFKQRKRLIAQPSESVLINVPNGFLWKNSALRTFSQLSRLVVYWIRPSFGSTSLAVTDNQAIATICLEPYRADQASLDAPDRTLNLDQAQLSFELGYQQSSSSPNSYSSDHVTNQLNQLLNTRTLRFYSNHSVDRIDLVIELIATSKGPFRFDWLQSVRTSVPADSSTRFHSSMRTSDPVQSGKQFELNDKNDKSTDKSNNKLSNINETALPCLTRCPEDGLCLRSENMCDQIAHCLTSGFDESPLVCDAKEHNRLEHFLSIMQAEQQQQQSKIDKITLSDSVFKSSWFILSTSCAALLTLVLLVCLAVYVRRRTKHPSVAHLQIGGNGCSSLHTGTLQTAGSASSTFSGNTSLTNSSCTNSMLCEKRLKKLKQKITNKDHQLKHTKHPLQSANALTLMRSSLEESGNFNPLITSFGNNSTTIHQAIHQQIAANQQAPADYLSTSEFQFELNQDRLTNYDFDSKQTPSDFSPLYKKIDPDEYSLKQQHIYYQPSYTTLQRADARLDNGSSAQRTIGNQERIDSRLDYSRLDQRCLDKPPLPPLPLVLQSAQQTPSLLAYHSSAVNDPTFGLRSSQLNNHHTIARQSLLDSSQAERLLMSTPIYDRVADRQQFANNGSSMHRSALFTSNRFASNRRFS